jgi:hypothetical protein
LDHSSCETPISQLASRPIDDTEATPKTIRIATKRFASASEG